MLILYGRSEIEAERVLRVLALGLVLTVIASRAAVLLKARMSFALYRPYLVSVPLAFILAPTMIAEFGASGVAGVLLVANSGGLHLVWRVRRSIEARTIVIATLVSITVAVLLTAS